MLAGGGMVMDSGAHYCDTIRYLFGDPETVYARAHQIADRKVSKAGEIVDDDNEDTWVATINFKEGTIGLWTWSCAAPGHDSPRSCTTAAKVAWLIKVTSSTGLMMALRSSSFSTQLYGRCVTLVLRFCGCDREQPPPGN